MTMYLLLAAHADGAALQELTADGAPHPDKPEPRVVSAAGLAGVVRELEQRRPRWIWHRTQDWYPVLLAAGVELERCYDLTLCGAILAHSEFTAHTGYAQNAEKLTQDDELELPRALQPPPPPADQGALFDDPGVRHKPRHSPEELRAEYAAQQHALAQVGGTGVERPADHRRQRLQLLLAAESAGAMIAAEMQHTGVPWREELHEQILADYLGPRPPLGHRPAKLESLAVELRLLLNSPSLNPDSPQELMRALHRNGIEVKTTRQWELKESTPPGDRAAAGVQETLPPARRQRLDLAGCLGQERPVPAGVRGGRGGLRPLGFARRRRAADSAPDPRRRPCRSRVTN